MSSTSPDCERWDMICNYMDEFITDKLVEIFTEEWSDGFEYKTDPDLVGRLCMLKDLAEHFEVPFDLLLRVHSKNRVEDTNYYNKIREMKK